MRGFRPRRRRGNSDSSNEPLGRLRRRCVAGALLAAAVYAGAFATDAIRHNPTDNMTIVEVEMAAVGVGALCAVIATTIWVVTQSVENALAVWKVASSHKATVRCEDAADTIPIGYGREIQQRRDDRHAV